MWLDINGTLYNMNCVRRIYIQGSLYTGRAGCKEILFHYGGNAAPEPVGGVFESQEEAEAFLDEKISKRLLTRT